jgi:hypothetical protein
MRTLSRSALTAVGLGAAAGAVWAYVRWLRSWQMHWGATDEEVARTGTRPVP